MGKIISRKESKELIKLKKIREERQARLEKSTGIKVSSSYNQRIVYLLIDCSSSMSNNEKLDQAKRGASKFSEEAIEKAYKLGLVKFESNAILLNNAINDLNVINNNIKQINIGGSTNMSDALQLAKTNINIKDIFIEKVICIVTDGMPNNREKALNIAKDLKRSGVDIITIGTHDADREFLELISTKKELSLQVNDNQLEQGIISMTKLLP